MQWRRRGADPSELQTLYPGVPAWMERKLLAWAMIMSQEPSTDEWGNPTTRPSLTILADYEVAVRRRVSLVNGFQQGGVAYLFRSMPQEEFLDFIDYLLFVASKRDDAARWSAILEQLLAEAGSEWTVGERDGYPSLQKRVPEGVAAAAESTIANAGSAGELLGEAWHAAFGRSPDTEEAYEKAIKAVEEAGARVVSPTNSRATLGTMVRDMRSQGNWRLSIEAPGGSLPVAMAEALWQGQESRHGGNNYRKPTQDEAEAAVLLAVPLVQWFASGALTRS